MYNLIKKFLFFFVFIFAFLTFLYKENNSLSKTYIYYKNNKIPTPFSNFKIVQVSDLHSKLFGKNQKKLINAIIKENPNIIVITGDIYYSYTNKIKDSLYFLKEISKLYPVYFVSGNHEQRDKNWNFHENLIKSYSIKIIDNKIEKIKIKDDYIQILGLKDPSFYDKKIRHKSFEDTLKNLSANIDKNKISILLSHRPEKFETYAKYKMDLVFSGHAHGGQIRFFNIGILSPSQGFFPKYTSGSYIKDDTTMVVSRGLGRTIFTTRLFNKPDIVVLKFNKTS